jgi:hypothetical protein
MTDEERRKQELDATIADAVALGRDAAQVKAIGEALIAAYLRGFDLASRTALAAIDTSAAKRVSVH